MSNTYYLASIARALRERVLGKVGDPEARSVLEASIRAVAGMADALDDERYLAPPTPVAGEALTPLSFPPENGAARPRTATAISAGVELVAKGTWLESKSGATDARAWIDWERTLMREAVASLKRQEAPALESPTDSSDDPLLIRPDAVQRYLRSRFGQNAVITEFRQATGGRSRQTVLFTLENDAGLPRHLVLQRDHPAGIASSGVSNEFPVLQTLARSRLKSPRPLFLETSAEPLGAAFIVTERLPGTIAGPDYFNPPRNPPLGLQLAEQLALLHSVDCSSLEGTLRHTLTRGETWAAELTRIEETFVRLQHWPSINATAAIQWMKRRVHEIGPEMSIVHNDTAFHNILVDGGEITGLLDWELVHIGHPAEDIGYCRPFLTEMDAWDGFTDAYVAAGGKAFTKGVVDYFSLRSQLHLMTLLQRGREVFERGITDDVNLAEVGTSFMPKLMLRFANIVATILE